MKTVQFYKASGAVKGYFHVRWTIERGNEVHELDIGVLESPAMNKKEIAENNDFFKSQGYTIKRVKS